MKARHDYAWPEALLPWVVAERVCEEAGRYLGVVVPRRRARWLAAKAEACFQGNERFRRRMRGEAPVEWLRVFMRHWLASLLKLEQPDLWRALPDSYHLGRALPAGGRTVPPPRVRRWNPDGVLRHQRWGFLRPDAGAGAPRVSRPTPHRHVALPHDAVYEYPIR